MSLLRALFSRDSGLVLAAACVIAASVFVLNTAIVSPGGGVEHVFAYRQIVFAVIGLGLAFAISRIPLETWQGYWVHAIVLAVAGVVAVRFVGTVVNGSRRWLDLGPVSLQPSEFGKVLAIVALAGFLGSRHREIKSPKVFISALALLGIPGLIIFIQPDFGTAQVYGYLALAMLFFAGARWLHFAILGGLVIGFSVLLLAVLPAVGIEVMHDYQIKRLTGFLDPEADAQGTNYQTIQAKVAIGSGQLTGRPGDEASQVQRGFLPEPQTDFIFATTVERYGFLGGGILLGLYMWLISRILSVVGSASTTYGRLIAGGVAMLFFCQVFVNVGMVLGLLPVTGVPLPMFSYGGSALWANMAALGLVAAVQRESTSPRARYTRRTGRPVGGFGSLRATSAERAGSSGVRRPSLGRQVSGSPLVGGGASRRRRRRRPNQS
ncbi:MAG: rod shape-determining protein RodA [Gaiellales bacterium]